MKKMWIRVNSKYKREDMKRQLSEIGRVENDPKDPQTVILTFHNQSDEGVRLAGFRLSQDFLKYFDDFDMVRE